MSEQQVQTREPSLLVAALPILFLILLLGAAVILFGDDASSGPSQLALIFAAVFTAVIGLLLGQKYDELEQAMIRSISLTFKACLILLMVGSMIGAWMLAGTAPAIIYFGLGILDPSWFYPACFIICALVSVSIGSSWTTAATVGLALISIAQILGLQPEIAAGAIISGAYFGDKMSPLSDSTNLAPAMVGADLFSHIRNMLWTTIPAAVISVILFSLISSDVTDAAGTLREIKQTQTLLDDQFYLGFFAFVPLILLLVLAWSKVPALPTIVAGTVAGCVVAVVFQSDVVLQFADPAGELAVGLAYFKGIWGVMTSGFIASVGNDTLDSLLSRGGMEAMLTTVWLIISAMCFGGMMEKTGLLQRLVKAALRGVKGTGSLILVTVLTSIGLNVVAADQYIAIVLPGRMYQLEFERRGLAPESLSRTLEDAGTMTSPLVPWNTCGAFMAASLGVATFDYAPWAFLCLLTPVIAVVYGFFDIRIMRLNTAVQE